MTRLRTWAEARSLERPTVPISSANILQWLGLGGKTLSGLTVTTTSALKFVAVYRSVALLAGTTAGLPLKTYDLNTRAEVNVPVIRNPHADLTSFEWEELLAAHLAMWGNSYHVKQREREVGSIVALNPVMPDRVIVFRAKDAISGTNPTGKLFAVNDQERTVSGQLPEVPPGDRLVLTPAEIFHVPAFGIDGLQGLSPLSLAREAVAAGLAAEEYANRLWANGALAGGVLKVPAKIDEPTAEKLKARWRERVGGLDRAHDVAVLDAGAEFQQLTIPPEDAQFLETRRFQVSEIARLYGIPPHLLGETDRSTSWGTGIEKQTAGFVAYTLKPGYLQRIENRVTKELCPPGVFAEFQIAGLLRGDHQTRAQFYKTMTEIGAMTIEEVRELENMPALDDTDPPEEDQP